MRRAELLQEILKTGFEEAYTSWQERRLTQKEARASLRRTIAHKTGVMSDRPSRRGEGGKCVSYFGRRLWRSTSIESTPPDQEKTELDPVAALVDCALASALPLGNTLHALHHCDLHPMAAGEKPPGSRRQDCRR